MFHRQAPTPTKTKHVVYLIAAVILGLLLSILLHTVIEAIYLDRAIDQGQMVQWYGGCALPWIVQILLPILGMVGGLMLGRWWWRVIYVEQRWLRRNNG